MENLQDTNERLAQPNEFSPDWDAMAVMVAEQQRMATEIERLKDGFNKSESRLHDVAVHCEQVERRLKDVNTAAMKLTHDLVCMDYDDDERLDRDRVMERIMQWRNEWDKAMQNNQLQMQPLRAAIEQPRQWQGLTDDEIDQVLPYCHNEFDLAEFREFARHIEAKLKEKNG